MGPVGGIAEVYVTFEESFVSISRYIYIYVGTIKAVEKFWEISHHFIVCRGLS